MDLKPGCLALDPRWDVTHRKKVRQDALALEARLHRVWSVPSRRLERLLLLLRRWQRWILGVSSFWRLGEATVKR